MSYCNNKWLYDPEIKCCFKNRVYARQDYIECLERVRNCEKNAMENLKEFAKSQTIDNSLESQIYGSSVVWMGGAGIAYFIAETTAWVAGTVGVAAVVAYEGLEMAIGFYDSSRYMELNKLYMKECHEVREKCATCSLGGL